MLIYRVYFSCIVGGTGSLKNVLIEKKYFLFVFCCLRLSIFEMSLIRIVAYTSCCVDVHFQVAVLQ